ncbi:MAG TPA: hypothetical protein VFU05_04790 [Cyclobacteriaceae bacterium]|nr:hypothetical protein [Cyclobacteriaceae bacterium]
MIRAFLVVVGFSLMLVSCTQQLVCPAYQSAYIYDKDALRKKFSYFNEDSTPKIYASAPGKTKYLIAEPTSYKKKVRSLQTVPARKVLTVLPDSLDPSKAVTGAELDSAARSIIDSTYVVDTQATDTTQLTEDSVYVITIDKEVRVLKYNFPDSLKFDPVTGKYLPEKPKYYIEEVGYNSEQDNYMWYLRDVLLLPDAKLAKEGANEKETGGNGSGAKKKKGLKGFFAGLFKKKDKSTMVEDSTLTAEPVQEEDYGYDDFDGKVKDSTAVNAPPVQQAQPASKPKKGLFNKKDKSSKKKTETSPAKKEDDSDGF